LVVWQLADEIRIATFRYTARAPFADDFRARRQADDAASSVCRNIAEGFGCDTDSEFARYLGYSRRSLNELLDTLRGAQLQGYVSPDELVPIRSLARRLFPAIGGLVAHLRKSHASRQPRPDRR